MKRSRLNGAVCASFCLMNVFVTPVHATGVSGQGTWETTLQGRDLDGDHSTIEAYYDTILGITWLADANYAGTTMDWATANAWAAGLSVGSVTSGWRLPNTNPIDGTTADDVTIAYNGTEDLGINISAPGTLYAGSTASEMAHLFYNTLGNKGYCTTSSVYPVCTVQTGWGLSNTGPFSNVQSPYYWSATEYAPRTNEAWIFGFGSGDQVTTGKTNGHNLYGWAVHSGDVGTAIVPLDKTVAEYLHWGR